MKWTIYYPSSCPTVGYYRDPSSGPGPTGRGPGPGGSPSPGRRAGIFKATCYSLPPVAGWSATPSWDATVVVLTRMTRGSSQIINICYGLVFSSVAYSKARRTARQARVATGRDGLPQSDGANLCSVQAWPRPEPWHVTAQELRV